MIKSEAFLTARKACDHVAGDQSDLGLVHLVITRLGDGDFLGGIFIESRLALQNEQVERP